MLRITKNSKRDNCVWLLSERQTERETERQRDRETEREGLKFSISTFEIIKLEKVCLIPQRSLW